MTRISSIRGLGAVQVSSAVGVASTSEQAENFAAVIAETAIQAEALTGLGWGGGIYLNYAFGLVWLAELAWAMVAGASYRTRPRHVGWFVRGFLLFMIINGGVIFVDGPQRWIGATIAGVLVWSWIPTGKRNTLIESVRPSSRKIQID